MARNKEALVLLLDVGPTMHKILPEVEKVCSMLVQKKLIYGKSDEVGVVLFGTEDTSNELEKEVSGYEHIVVLHGIKVVDGAIAEALLELPRGTAHGDFLDAIVVGMDMLVKKFGSTNKGKQRLCLITDAQFPIKEANKGTKADQVDAISVQMKAHGVKLDCVITRGEHFGAASQKIMDENDSLLKCFSSKTVTKVVYVGHPTSFLGSLRTRNISPVMVYRGDLELSSRMKIKVWVYKKTAQENFPTLKKYSDKAPPTDKFATHELKVDFEYKSIEDHKKVVPPEQRIKGYRYGPQVVPISSDEWEAVKFKPEKSVKLLGFTDDSNIMRHYYLKDVYVFIPEPDNRRAIVALSSVVRAMKEMGKVAILRCVWRQGQGNVVVGVLTPNISSLDNMTDVCYFNVLPFAEDVREFQFPSFKSFPSFWQPNEQQQEAADNLVKMLDLAPSGGEEVLPPDLTPNPVLERFYRFLELRLKREDAVVPPLDESFKKITEPDPELVSRNKSVIEIFFCQFELTKSTTKKRSYSNLSGSERESKRQSATDEEKDGRGNDASNIQSVNSSITKVDKIGDLTPIKDFETMMARRDSSKWVIKAISEMKNYITDLLENSYEGNTYPKAIECLMALRRACILEQEPKEFNQFLRDLYERWKTTDLLDFFGIITSRNITLISKGAAADSDVTEEEAKSFPAKPELAS